jgi:hypothetical protein
VSTYLLYENGVTLVLFVVKSTFLLIISLNSSFRVGGKKGELVDRVNRVIYDHIFSKKWSYTFIHRVVLLVQKQGSLELQSIYKKIHIYIEQCIGLLHVPFLAKSKCHTLPCRVFRLFIYAPPAIAELLHCKGHWPKHHYRHTNIWSSLFIRRNWAFLRKKIWRNKPFLLQLVFGALLLTKYVYVALLQLLRINRFIHF